MSRPDAARRIGYVPRSSSSPPAIRVFDTILTGRRPRSCGRVSLTWNLGDGRRDPWRGCCQGDLALRDFSQLSGDRKQRALAARTRPQEPAPLLGEPTCNLDVLPQLVAIEARRQPGEREERLIAVFCGSCAWLRNPTIFP